jgi:hypothetical protein
MLKRILSQEVPMKKYLIAAGVLLFVILAVPAGHVILVNARHGANVGRNIRTMLNLERVATALEHYRAVHGEYPAAGTVGELRAALGSLDIPNGDWSDGWKHPLVVEVTREGYLLSSPGEDGEGGHELDGPVSRPGHSITLRNGIFVQCYVRAEKAARGVEARIAAARGPEAAP